MCASFLLSRETENLTYSNSLRSLDALRRRSGASETRNSAGKVVAGATGANPVPASEVIRSVMMLLLLRRRLIARLATVALEALIARAEVVRSARSTQPIASAEDTRTGRRSAAARLRTRLASARRARTTRSFVRTRVLPAFALEARRSGAEVVCRAPRARPISWASQTGSRRGLLRYRRSDRLTPTTGSDQRDPCKRQHQVRRRTRGRRDVRDWLQVQCHRNKSSQARARRSTIESLGHPAFLDGADDDATRRVAVTHRTHNRLVHRSAHDSNVRALIRSHHRSVIKICEKVRILNDLQTSTGALCA